MTLRKTIYGLSVICLLLAPGLFFQKWAHSEEAIELKISHFGPADYVQQREVLEPWAKKIEKLSQGRVKFTIFPKEALGVAARQYDMAIEGIADISFGLPSYTPGRFPLTSVMRLPFLGDSGEQASLILWYLYEKFLKDEYKDVKVLWLFCHGPGQLHTVNKEVRTLEDLKGLRIRVADLLLGKAIELLGGIPVVSTAPEGYKLMQEGKIDGACLPWEGAYNFKYLEFCKYHAIINMYTLPFFVVMNKEKYESLPADLRKIIDENSGEEMSAAAGRANDREDAAGKGVAQGRGDFIYVLPQQELEGWRKITMPLGDSWKQEAEEKGQPGQEVLAFVIEFPRVKK
jgi:TRAP-type C4-dicarboxylate transport system substrate-binding protein